jgi:hypothetical protein
MSKFSRSYEGVGAGKMSQSFSSLRLLSPRILSLPREARYRRDEVRVLQSLFSRYRSHIRTLSECFSFPGFMGGQASGQQPIRFGI